VANLYVASWRSNPVQGAQMVKAFARAPATGTLTPYPAPWDCVKAAEHGNGTCPVANGMNDPNAIAISPDGTNVYVADRTGGVLTLQRAMRPHCKAVHKHSKHDHARTFKLHCSDPNDDSLKYGIVAVKHGKLGKIKHGEVVFTPNRHFKGKAWFEVISGDRGLLSNVVKDTLKTTASRRHHH
jgi:DNA-binding beta-propeller fold protein YncE